MDNDAEEKHGSRRPSGPRPSGLDEILKSLPAVAGTAESRQAPFGGSGPSGAATGYSGATTLKPLGGDASRKRGSFGGSQSGTESMSTDSEWEKVEGDR